MAWGSRKTEKHNAIQEELAMREINVLLLNGSPRENGNTAVALREMEKVFAQNGVRTETVLLGNRAIPLPRP